MPRATNAVASRHRRKKVMKLARGYFGRRKNVWTVAKNAVENAYQSYQSSLKQLEAAQSYQRLIEKGYKEGVNTFIESIDARNQFTSAQLLVTINQYRLLSAKANYERETASYELSNQ